MARSVPTRGTPNSNREETIRNDRKPPEISHIVFPNREKPAFLDPEKAINFVSLGTRYSFPTALLRRQAPAQVLPYS